MSKFNVGHFATHEDHGEMRVKLSDDHLYWMGENWYWNIDDPEMGCFHEDDLMFIPAH